MSSLLLQKVLKSSVIILTQSRGRIDDDDADFLFFLFSQQWSDVQTAAVIAALFPLRFQTLILSAGDSKHALLHAEDKNKQLPISSKAGRTEMDPEPSSCWRQVFYK